MFIIAFQLHSTILTRKQNPKNLKREGSLKFDLLEFFQHAPYMIHSPSKLVCLLVFSFKFFLLNNIFYVEVHNKKILLMVTELSNRWDLKHLVKKLYL